MTQTKMLLGGGLLVLAAMGTVGCNFQRGSATPPSGGEDAGATDVIERVEVGDTSVTVDMGYDLIMSDANTEAGPTVDANCGNMNFPIQAAPPDLMIVLDRSGSMNQDETGMMCGGGGGGACPNSKWIQMTAAINEVVMQTETSINWGLKFFGTGSSGCAVDPGASVPIAAMNAMPISTAMAARNNQPATSTPTRAGVLAAADYLDTVMDTNPKVILLATDGLPNCPETGGTQDPDAPGAIQAVTDVAARGYPVFVIGIATGGSTADDTLNMMAVAGGKPRMDTPQYYPASTTADLVSVLSMIKGMVMQTCTYNIGTPPADADLSKINVTVGGTKISEDPAEGWTYGPNMQSIIFNGQICEQLKSGMATDVRILYGCGIVVQ